MDLVREAIRRVILVHRPVRTEQRCEPLAPGGDVYDPYTQRWEARGYLLLLGPRRRHSHQLHNTVRRRVGDRRRCYRDLARSWKYVRATADEGAAARRHGERLYRRARHRCDRLERRRFVVYPHVVHPYEITSQYMRPTHIRFKRGPHVRLAVLHVKVGAKPVHGGPRRRRVAEFFGIILTTRAARHDREPPLHGNTV